MAITELPKPTLLQSIALGGASCIFTVNFTHPIELVKTRMQVTGNGLGVVFNSALKNEGVAGFWKGIVWAWGREGSYASIKLGGYAPVRDALGASGADGAYKTKHNKKIVLVAFSCILTVFVSFHYFF
jgi:hypothetical protein